VFVERFIHGEIYKVRADVNGVVHTHSKGAIPFGISQVPLKPVIHTASFLRAGVPVWEIREKGGVTSPHRQTGTICIRASNRFGKRVPLMSVR
jgi:ribulose-5-phosphate 4-epimerase/fuculose-1-phosphate aldolase